jgi:hypothetical protein
MPVIYSPKERFQKDANRRAAWAKLASEPLLHEAILHTQAQMAAAGFGPDHMNGVNNFIVGLLNLSEDIQRDKPIPVKHLESYEENFIYPKPKP